MKKNENVTHLFTYSLINLFTSKKKAAFTLAEVLITLGIIGVVAALTIPGLINNYKAARLHSQFLKSYSTIQQVFKQMEADDISLNPADYNTATGKFYKTFMKYLQAPFDCGTNSDKNKKNILPCYYADLTSTDKPYKTYDQKNEISFSIFDDGEIALQDGTLLLFENQKDANFVWVHVDLNGYNNPPNIWGYDLFTFEFLDGELRAMGDKNTMYTDSNLYCNQNRSNAYNGITCAHEAKVNNDYFKHVVKFVK